MPNLIKVNHKKLALVCFPAMAFCEAGNSDEPGLKGLEHWTIGAIQSGVQALAATAKDPHHLAANPLVGSASDSFLLVRG